MNDSNPSRSFILPTALAICVLGAVLTAFTGWNYYQDQTQKEALGYTRAGEQAEQVKEAIETEMQAEMAMGQDIADRLSSGELSYDQAVDYSQAVFNLEPHLLGMAISFAPYAYDPEVKLYAPYFLRDAQGNVSLIQIEELYDYTDPSLGTSKWYVQAMQAGKGTWINPYYGKASDDILITYSIPFSAPDNRTKLAGVVVLAHSVTNTFKNFIQNTDLGYGGYLFLVNDKNTITFHPEQGLISQDVSEIAKRVDGFDLIEALNSANSDQEKIYKGTIHFHDSQTNGMGKLDTSWLFVHNLTNPAGWKVAVVINTLDRTYNPQGTIRQLITLYQMMLMFFVGLAMLIIRVDKMTSSRLMAFSVTLGTFFLIGILWIWYLVYSNPELNHQRVLVNDVGVQRSLEPMHEAFDDFSSSYPQEIPTGILIENLTMNNQSIKISGYLWQKYPMDFPEDAINFPQFTDQIGALTHEEVYRYTKSNLQVVGWFFSTELQQRFDNHRYPLDQAIIKIQIEPSKLSEKYILVPATLDYDYMGPGFKPGLANNLKVRGWTIKNSFFTYDTAGYGTNFGLFRQIPKDSIPNLVYNVRMVRDILSPIIAYCIVIYIVVMQVYGISVLKIQNSYQVLSIAAALFLVVAITHNGVRDTVAVNGVVYLEYYYILLYLTILATSINAIMWAANVQLPIMTYRDNLFIKIVFWPLFLGISLFFTMVTFYPF
jgi:hypothetical protein